MKTSKLIVVLFLIAAVGSVVFAGGQEEKDSGGADVQTSSSAEKQSGGKIVTLIDYNGKEVTLTVPVKRAVVFVPAMFSVIKVIKAENKVIGIIDSIKYEPSRYPHFSKLPIVGTPDVPDFEAILALNPDIVLVPYWTTDEIEEKLEPDIPVFRLNVGPPLTYKEDVKKLSVIFGEEENAEVFIGWYEGFVNTVTERVNKLPETEKPLIFDFYGGDWGMSAGPPYGTYGKENFWVAPLIDMAGGINISGGLPGDWIVVDPEWVITKNPDIILREVFPSISGKDVSRYEAIDFSKITAMRDEIIQKSALNTTTAVKTGRVQMVDGSLIQGEWFIGLLYLAKWFHPNHFTDINPQDIHQEFLTKFLRINYDLSKRGVFVFPE